MSPPPASFTETRPGSFIFEWPRWLPADVCAEMIRRFEAHPEEHQTGRIGQLAQVDASIKRSTDLPISHKPHWKDLDRALFQSLGRAIVQFRELFPFFKGPFKDIGYQLQRTRPGEFYTWHIDGGSHDFADRQLVAVWYLNDVPAPGGATEFLFQDVRVQPERGKLVLFPPFWTHEHRGAPVEQGVKYIATTWVVFA